MSLASRVRLLERVRAGECDCGTNVYLKGGCLPIPEPGPCPACGRWRVPIVIADQFGNPIPGSDRMPRRASQVRSPTP